MDHSFNCTTIMSFENYTNETWYSVDKEILYCAFNLLLSPQTAPIDSASRKIRTKNIHYPNTLRTSYPVFIHKLSIPDTYTSLLVCIMEGLLKGRKRENNTLSFWKLRREDSVDGNWKWSTWAGSASKHSFTFSRCWSKLSHHSKNARYLHYLRNTFIKIESSCEEC